jgi:hypothetical protein
VSHEHSARILCQLRSSLCIYREPLAPGGPPRVPELRMPGPCTAWGSVCSEPVHFMSPLGDLSQLTPCRRCVQSGSAALFRGDNKRKGLCSLSTAAVSPLEYFQCLGDQSAGPGPSDTEAKCVIVHLIRQTMAKFGHNVWVLPTIQECFLNISKWLKKFRK